MKNTGIEFERVVEALFHKLNHDAENCSVEHNVKVDGPEGERQIDVLLKAKVAGFWMTVAIECKDYSNKNIQLEHIDAFESKLRDIKANKGIFICTKGFSPNAIDKARRKGIDVCTLKEALDPAWSSQINFPIFLEQVELCKIQPIYNMSLNPKDSFQIACINGIKTEDLILEKWNDLTLIYDSSKDEQLIELAEIKSPYYVEVTDANGIEHKREISAPKFNIQLTSTFYKINFSQLKNIKILDKIITQEKVIMVDSSTLKVDMKGSVPINKNEYSNHKGLSLAITAYCQCKVGHFMLP